MKITVSLPDDLVASVDHEASRRGSSRSALLAQLLREWHEEALTERINAHLKVYPLTKEEADLERRLGETVAEVLD